MRKYRRILFVCLAFLLLLNGCTIKNIDEMYRLPRRSEDANALQSAIDDAMKELVYASPVSGTNQQTVQQIDLDDDGEQEYLVYARTAGENPLRILIFDKVGSYFQLVDTVESNGSAFEQVEYVDFDKNPGKEIIVGKCISDQVVSVLDVYTYHAGKISKLLSAQYHEFLTCKPDSSEKTNLFLIHSEDADKAVAVLYSYHNGEVIRSSETELSAAVSDIKQIKFSQLDSGEPAVYVASSFGEDEIITDVLAVSNGHISNVSRINASGTSIQTLRNYYVYADDVDSDGVVELPDLIAMKPLEQVRIANQQYLIRWYALDINGQEIDKCFTFHNFDGGWYLILDAQWADRLTVSQEGNRYLFYLWDHNFETYDLVMSIYALSGTDRVEQSKIDGRFALFQTEDMIYAAKLESGNAEIQFEKMTAAFHLIHREWKTGEK